jgi:hypothetical protein
MNYNQLTRKYLVEECKKRIDEKGERRISNCTGGNKIDIIERLKKDDKKNVIQKKDKASPKKVIVKSPTKTPKKVIAKSTTKTPKKVIAKSTTKTPKEVIAKSPTKTPKKVIAKSTTKTPKKVIAKSPKKTPPKNKFLGGVSSVCDNENILQGGSVNEESHLIYYTDNNNKTYCFGVSDLEYLKTTQKNPFTQTHLTPEFFKWLSIFLQTDTYKEWLSELHKEKIKEISFNQKKDVIDNVLQQGLYIINIESEKISDPYINVDHFLKLIKENPEYSILPNEINLFSNDSIINYLYYNINTVIPQGNDKYSVIYMVVKYAYNKEIIDNEEESEENKEFAESWNETFEDLIGKLYSIDVIDRIFIDIKRNNKLAKKHINLFLKAVRRGRVDILEIMSLYLTDNIVKKNINEAFIWAAENGHLHVLKWLKNKYITDEKPKTYQNSAFIEAAKNGHLHVLKWLKKNFKKKFDINSTFVLAADHGHLEVLKWLKDTYNITEKEAKSNNNEAFRGTASSGHLKVLKWLKYIYNITESEAKSDNNYAFRLAAHNGHLKVLKWLKETFHITDDEAKSEKNFAFRWASYHGYLDILKWLKKTFNLTEEEAKLNNNEAFRYAAENGHLEVLKWLTKTFKITEEESKLNNNEAFRLAAENGHLHVLKWLKENYNITKKEAKLEDDYALRAALSEEHLDVLKWLKDTYNITEKDIDW